MRSLNRFLIAFAILIVSAGCGLFSTTGSFSKKITGTVTVSVTSPGVTTSAQTASVDITWDTMATETNGARDKDPYTINVYSQSGCGGAIASTSVAQSKSYSLTGLVNGSIRSVGIIAYDKNDEASQEVCTPTITGRALIGLVQPPSANYLSLDVDFVNKLAYGGSQQSGTFFDVIDFNDEKAPVLFRKIGSASTPSTTATVSRGIALYNGGTRLLVASNGANLLETYDLTATPRTGTWTKLSTVTGLTAIRKIAKVVSVSGTQTRVYAALRQGLGIVDITEPTGTGTLTVANSTAFTDGNCYGNGAIIDATWMLSACYESNAAKLVNISTYAADQTVTVPNPSSGFNLMWTTSTNATSDKVFIGGTAHSFLSYLSTATPRVQVRHQAETSSLARDSVFVTESGKELLYAAGGTVIDVWDVTSITAPIHVGQYDIVSEGGASEIYGLKVDPISHRAVVASSSGHIIIVNTQMIAPPVVAYTSY